MWEQKSLWESNFVSFGYVSRSEIARSCGISILNILCSLHTVFHTGCAILHPQQWCTGFPFLHILTSTCYLSFWQQLFLQVEKAMATHSSTLAWKIRWTEEPGRLQSMRSLRIGHYWATSLSLFTFMHWRRKWQPTPVFLPGESQGWGSLVGCCLWGCTESDTTEAT